MSHDPGRGAVSMVRNVWRLCVLGIVQMGAVCAQPAITPPVQVSPRPAMWPPVPAPDGAMEPGPGWPPAVVNPIRKLPGRPFKERFVDVDGYHVRTIEAGSGPVTIVSFPGSGGLEMSTAKDILAQTYHVVEINPPGWGPDAVLAGERDQKDLAVSFVHVLDRMGVGQFHLIGTSMGCNHALWAAELFPARVLSLTFEGGECFTRPQDHRVQTLRAQEAEAAARGGQGFNDDYGVWAGWPAYQWSENKWWQTPSFQARLMRRRYVDNFPYTRNAHHDEEVARAHDVHVPAVALVGDRDEVQTLSVAEAWRQHMPQVRFAIVAGATHDIQNSQPEQFVELMEACTLDPALSKLRCPAD